MDKLVNTYLGQYWVIEIIGQGSTSTVYKAYQSALDRYVAIKVLFRHLSPQFTSRFKREAQAIARLQHPNILPIYDFAQQDELYYFVIQYIEDSVTLADLLVQRPLEPLAALRLTHLLLAALGYAHESGIIHRDIKPSNILMPRPDWPLLADFGIAQITDDNQRLTPTGQTVGTVSYMAPERATDRPADVRTDLYAVGVVLFEMITGQVPFHATTPLAVLMQHVHQAPPAPHSLAPDLPPFIEAIILRALEKNPDQRYQNAAEMADAVRQAIVQLEQIEAARVATGAQAANRVPPNQARTTLKLPPEDPSYDDSTTTQLVPPVSPAPEAPRLPQQQNGRVSPLLRGRYWAALALLLAFAAISMILADGLSGVPAPVPPTSVAYVPNSAPTGENTARTDASVVSTPSGTTASATPASAIAPSPAAPIAGPGVYVVQPGDTLSSIATDYGITVQTLLVANNLSDPNLIQAGQTLVIPSAAETAPAVAALPPSPAPTSAPTARPELSPAPPTDNGIVYVHFEDTDWQGGFKQQRTYGGRSATWIYGYATQYSSMQVVFEVSAQPAGTATLSIEGMDSEDSSKTPISVSVNGTEVYNGSNPLPNDDYQLDTGNWATHSFTFDATLLRPGRNEIKISNLAEGTFRLPPFFLLDYADLSYDQ